MLLAELFGAIRTHPCSQTSNVNRQDREVEKTKRWLHPGSPLAVIAESFLLGSLREVCLLLEVMHVHGLSASPA